MVSVTVHEQSRSVTNLQMKVVGQPASGGSSVQALFVFTTNAPGQGWVALPVQGGYLSYYPTQATAQLPEPAILPDLSGVLNQVRYVATVRREQREGDGGWVTVGDEGLTSFVEPNTP